ncbi:MAG: UPF0175 family protein [Microcystaceae cyanobacterium]
MLAFIIMNLSLPTELLETAQMTEIEMLQEIAIMLYQQQRIPLEKGAQLSQMTNDDFYQLLINRQILIPPTDNDDEHNELILASLRTSLQQVKEGKVHPISNL